MKSRNVVVLREAIDDLNDGKSFYDRVQTGVGNYFWDCLVNDIESLRFFAGIHNKSYGIFRMLAKRFPYAIYYEINNDVVHVTAVLPMHRDPNWIVKQLKERT